MSQPDKTETKVKVDYELQCTVCLEFPISPIYTCKNGHILCSLCHEQVKKCALCKEELLVCGLAERIARSKDFVFPCKNAADGCTLRIKSTEMYDHLKNCYYRPINCCEGCSQLKCFALGQFYHHLKNVHNVENLSIDVKDVANLSFIAKSVELLAHRFSVQAFHIFGKSFLLHSVYESQHLHWWVTIIDGLSESQDFNCKINLIINSDVYDDYSKRMKFSWTVPVLPITGHDNFEKVVKTGKLVSLHANLIMHVNKCEGERESTRTENKYAWYLKITPLNSKMFSSLSNFFNPYGNDVKNSEPVVFTGLTGHDTILKNGVNTPVITRFQCVISNGLKPAISFEEARHEYYNNHPFKKPKPLNSSTLSTNFKFDAPSTSGCFFKGFREPNYVPHVASHTFSKKLEDASQRVKVLRNDSSSNWKNKLKQNPNSSSVLLKPLKSLNLATSTYTKPCDTALLPTEDAKNSKIFDESDDDL